MAGKKNKYLVDTKIIIDQIRGFKNIFDIKIFRNDADIRIYICVVAEMEIYAGKSMDNIHTQNIVDKLLEKLLKIPVDSQIARYAGEIKRKFPINFPDALMAASAVVNDCTLLTRNIKHFKGIPKLKVLNP